MKIPFHICYNIRRRAQGDSKNFQSICKKCNCKIFKTIANESLAQKTGLKYAFQSQNWYS